MLLTHILKTTQFFLNSFRNRWLIIVILSMLTTLAALCNPFLTRYVVDELIAKGQTERLGLFLFLLLGVALAIFLFNVTTQRIIVAVAQHFSIQLQSTLFSHVFHAPLSFFKKTNAGELLYKSAFDAEQMNHSTIDLVTTTLINMMMVVGAAAAMFHLQPLLATIVTSGTILQVLLILMAFLPLKRRSKQEITSHENVLRTVSDAVNDISIYKNKGIEDRLVRRIRKRMNDWGHDAISSRGTQVIFTHLNGFVQTCTAFIVLWFGARLVIDGHTSLGTLLSFAGLQALFSNPFMALTQFALSFSENSVAFERFFATLDVVPETPVVNSLTPPVPTTQSALIAETHTPWKIKLDHVSLAYQDTFLKDCSLTIQKGEKIAITGVSGSGKSSLAQMLLGHLKPVHGKLTVANKDLATLALQPYRRQLFFLPQSHTLAAGSIRDNCTLNQPCSEAELWQNLDQVQMKETLCLRHDLDHFYPAFQSILSIGEQKRIALSSLFSRYYPLVILDELEAGLDHDTYVKILRALDDHCRKSTVIFLCHSSKHLAVDRRFTIENNALISVDESR